MTLQQRKRIPSFIPISKFAYYPGGSILGRRWVITEDDANQLRHYSVMKLAILQLDSKIREPARNIANADAIIASAPLPPGLDLLVLPELAFTGYNFPSLETITPFLEPTAAGRTTIWAIGTAKQFQCYVSVGYPEIATDVVTQASHNYNSTVTVAPSGKVVAHYRKSFLYYTDESWATESPDGFSTAELGALGKVSFGICMDINPYQFTAPWNCYEFASQVLTTGAELVVLSMAWLTHIPSESIMANQKLPDTGTLAYWAERFTPLIKASKGGKDIIVIFANRTGSEKNEVDSMTTRLGQVIPLNDAVRYAGSSCVMRFTNGDVQIWSYLGAAEEGSLIVDTVEPPQYGLAQRPDVEKDMSSSAAS